MAMVDKAILKEVRLNYPEKFQSLCNTHLSFHLELPNGSVSSPIERTSPFRFSKKRKISGEPVTNIKPLNFEYVQQILKIVDYLSSAGNITEEGLFRKSGSVQRQRQLKEIIKSGSTVEFESSCYSVHDCANVLKILLSELPEPLVTNKYAKVYQKITDVNKCGMAANELILIRKRQLKSLQLLSQMIPTENAYLLNKVLLLLHGVSKARSRNCLKSESLALIFSPHVICSKNLSPTEFRKESMNGVAVLTLMIDSAPKLTHLPKEFMDDLKLCLETKNSDVPDAIQTSIRFCAPVTGNDGLGTPSADLTSLCVAELYAHVQNMPESAKKAKYIKKFNKQNGQGTPHMKTPVRRRSKSVGDRVKDYFQSTKCSIKKKLSHEL